MCLSAGELSELPVILVAVLCVEGREGGLVVKDGTGAMPCEVSGLREGKETD